MPTRPKPIERKRRAGNPGKRALPAKADVVVLPAADEVPDPIRPLGPVGEQTWERIWKAGRVWLAATADLEAVQLICELQDERIALRARVLLGGCDWRDRTGLRKLDVLVADGLGSIGFTPAERTRMAVGEVRATSTLERLRASRVN